MTTGNDETAVIIGSDHAAYRLKEQMKTWLSEQHKLVVEDAGTDGEGSVDYPDFGIRVAEAVSTGRYNRGILLCGTGLGMSMVANRFAHVRAALCNDLFSAIMSRKHNDSNLLVVGARVIGDELAREILATWLNTPFEGGRHQGRLDKFDSIHTCKLD